MPGKPVVDAECSGGLDCQRREGRGILLKMKRFVLLVLVICSGALVGAFGQGLDDEYVQIYRQIQEADTLSNTAPSQALAKYLDAQVALDRLHKGSPEWNTRIVTYRLSYLAERIAALSPNGAASAKANESKAGPDAAKEVGQPAAPADWQAQLANLQERVGQLQSDRAVLEAKLKEALALRPAAVDPALLAKAEEKIQALQKENELLKATKANEKPVPVPTVDTKQLEETRHSLADANRQVSQQATLITKLTTERDGLASRLKAASSSTVNPAELVKAQEKIKLLQKENESLKAAKLAEKPVPVVSADTKQLEETRHSLAEANHQVSQQASQIATLTMEKEALANRLKQVNQPAPESSPSTSPTSEEQNSRIKQLEKERDNLQKRLDASTKDRKRKGDTAQVQALENDLASARARLEVLEAQASPYSADELELLNRPEAKIPVTDSNAVKKPTKELPPGSAALVSEAQRYFVAKEYDKAEAAYSQVLQKDPKNVAVLGNLAAIQVEAGHFDKADATIQEALALDPEDPYSLYVLGMLRFRQSKYDDALGALSRAAKLDPQNADIENYLGLALSEKGMRVPAEAALRKAIQLQPGSGAAHYNLAVVYATQQPPAIALARWHYQKAIASGHPHNAELEKRFEARP
jgi:tetratricopeptide (TPR) repeat protein